MPEPVIYFGAIKVDADDYKHSVRRNARGDQRFADSGSGATETEEDEASDYEMISIDSLDVPVTQRSCLRFTLEYPFPRKFDGVIVRERPVCLRDIVDEIRLAYRAIYDGAVVQSIPGMLNVRVVGPYAEAFHDIGLLYIEVIWLVEEEGRLRIGIGS